MNRRSVNDVKKTKVFCTLSSAFIGLLVICIFLLAFSYIMTKIDAPDGVISLMSVTALSAGAFSGSYIASKRRRQNGMLIGIAVGLIIYSCILIAGIIYTRSSGGIGFLPKLIIAVICGAIGGILGVNSKQKRY